MRFLALLFLLFLLLVPPVKAAMSQERCAVIDAVVLHLKTRYVDSAVGARAAEALRTAIRSGDLDQIDDPDRFAQELSALLQRLTGDGHLNVEFSTTPVKADAGGAFTKEQMERWYGAHLNYGIQRIDRLENNVGYIDLRAFAPLDMGGDTLVAAMNVLADMDAMIIDLRSNGGGMGDAADLVASYLFDEGRQPLTGIYDRPTDTLTQRFTQVYVPGRRFGGVKPVYVLISADTFSAAEALAYNLQALDRAIIVGETSGGGAHPFDYLPVSDHFVLWSVTARSINPITGGNWQDVGVQPDIETASEQALDAALAHLHHRLR